MRLLTYSSPSCVKTTKYQIVTPLHLTAAKKLRYHQYLFCKFWHFHFCKFSQFLHLFRDFRLVKGVGEVNKSLTNSVQKRAVFTLQYQTTVIESIICFVPPSLHPRIPLTLVSSIKAFKAVLSLINSSCKRLLLKTYLILLTNRMGQ